MGGTGVGVLAFSHHKRYIKYNHHQCWVHCAGWIDGSTGTQVMEQEVTQLINVQDFLQKIETIAADKRIDFMDAVLWYCSNTGLEIETAAELIRKNAKFKARIKTEAENSGYLPKTAKLPI